MNTQSINPSALVKKCVSMAKPLNTQNDRATLKGFENQNVVTNNCHFIYLLLQ
jgi:hypothetical protein